MQPQHRRAHVSRRPPAGQQRDADHHDEGQRDRPGGRLLDGIGKDLAEKIETLLGPALKSPPNSYTI